MGHPRPVKKAELNCVITRTSSAYVSSEILTKRTRQPHPVKRWAVAVAPPPGHVV